MRWVPGGPDMRYLRQQRQGWYAYVDVPPKLVPIIGKRRLQRTLKTRVLSIAQQRRWEVVKEFQARISQAKIATSDADPDSAASGAAPIQDIIDAARRWRSVLESLHQGDTTNSYVSDPEMDPILVAQEGIEQSIEEIARDFGPAASREFVAVLSGADPTVTFRQAAAHYIEAHRAGWRSQQHAHEWPRTLELFAYGVIGDTPVGKITTEHLLQILKPIWKTKTETATRVRGRIEMVLDFAATRSWRSGENPARWRGHLQHLLPKPSKVAAKDHYAAMPWRDVPAFMDRLRQRSGPAAAALQFIILTAARLSEVAGAAWGEIDLKQKIWIVPPERMKAHKEHRVPLTDTAIAVLGEPRRPSDLLFPSPRDTKPLRSPALLSVLDDLGEETVTTHGFRSSFRDWAAETTDHPREVVEMALAHVVGSKTEAAYRRGNLMEKRRRLMEDWAEFCLAAK